MFAYVGTRTSRLRNARGEGISVFALDETSGFLRLVQVHKDLVNPSYLAINRSATRLYTIHGDEQSVSSFTIDRASGRIEFLNQQQTGGKNPVHLALDQTERFLVVSNHLSSSIAVLPISSNGELQPLHQLINLTGNLGPHRVEQTCSKPHFNGFDPSGEVVVVPDKGLDRTSLFRFQGGKLVEPALCDASSREAAGPRHAVFHPTQPWVYIVNELDSTVSACRANIQLGRLEPFQIIPSVSDRFTGNSRAAGIQISRSGRVLYVSNRGENSIGVFEVDSSSGLLMRIQTQSSKGKTPRFFTLSPDEKWLFALNEDSDTIERFSIDGHNGTLTHSGCAAHCASPVCMVFAT